MDEDELVAKALKVALLGHKAMDEIAMDVFLKGKPLDQAISDARQRKLNQTRTKRGDNASS